MQLLEFKDVYSVLTDSLGKNSSYSIWGQMILFPFLLLTFACLVFFYLFVNLPEWIAYAFNYWFLKEKDE